MESNSDLYELMQNGGIFYDVEGETPEEVYKNICAVMPVPSNCDRSEIARELVERESILSTAVGNGIAIPHPRKPLVKEIYDERVIVCFPKNPLSMNAPDEKKVFVMFILLTKSTQSHLQVLSSLAKLIHNDNFKKILESKPSMEELLENVKKNLL